eukprot:SAG25_NODE_103_length_15482_cov_9.187415_15_plen_236_part_00
MKKVSCGCSAMMRSRKLRDCGSSGLASDSHGSSSTPRVSTPPDRQTSITSRPAATLVLTAYSRFVRFENLFLENSVTQIGGFGRPSMLSSDRLSAPAWRATRIDGPLHCGGGGGGCGCGGPTRTWDVASTCARLSPLLLLLLLLLTIVCGTTSDSCCAHAMPAVLRSARAARTTIALQPPLREPSLQRVSPIAATAALANGTQKDKGAEVRRAAAAGKIEHSKNFLSANPAADRG